MESLQKPTEICFLRYFLCAGPRLTEMSRLWCCLEGCTVGKGPGEKKRQFAYSGNSRRPHVPEGKACPSWSSELGLTFCPTPWQAVILGPSHRLSASVSAGAESPRALVQFRWEKPRWVNGERLLLGLRSPCRLSNLLCPAGGLVNREPLLAFSLQHIDMLKTIKMLPLHSPFLSSLQPFYNQV